MYTFTPRAARINAKLSVKEAASELNINEDTLYRYENGKTSPNIGTAIKMAKLYGVTVNEIDFAVDEGSEKPN